MTPTTTTRRTRTRPLTADEQRLVEGFEPFVSGLVYRVPADIRQHLGGDDAVASDVRLRVVLAAIRFDPSMGSGGGMPFGAFAHLYLARWLPGYVGRAKRRRRVWYAMPEHNGERSADEIPDHRDAADPVLRAWHDPDYTEQRREHLDWRTRVLLYLRTVGGMTRADAGAAMGMDEKEARQLEYLAGVNLAYVRNPWTFETQPTGYRTRIGVYARGCNAAGTVGADGKRKCPRCPALIGESGPSYCERCREKRRIESRERYAARKAAGLCAQMGCAAPPMAGRPYCYDHHEYKVRAQGAKNRCAPGKATGRRTAAPGAGGCP